MFNRYYCRRTLSVALVAPAVRTVVAEVWLDDGAPKHAFFPVLAIAARVERTYSAVSDAEPDEGGTEKELLEAGWSVAEQAVRHDVLFEDPVYGDLTTDAEYREDNEHSRIAVCACPWPPAEDEERLAPVVARLVEHLTKPAVGVAGVLAAASELPEPERSAVLARLKELKKEG